MIFSNQVQIKGTLQGLSIHMGPGLWEQAVAELEARLAENESFYRGARASLQIGERILSRAEVEQVGTLLGRFGITLTGLSADSWEMVQLARRLGLETPAVKPPPVPPAAADHEQAHPPAESVQQPALLVQRTLRSGQSLNHAGPVVLIGDVNPGAEIVAAGHVVVWGKLRGTVHAGAPDNKLAMVCALTLAPTQLRIAGVVGYDPGKQNTHGRGRKQAIPEMASLQDDKIVVVPWQE